MQGKDKECMVEIGCGLNPVLDVLRGVVAPEAVCYGFDISAEAQRQNFARFSWGHWRVGDVAEGLECLDGIADFVCSSHVIEHLEDPYQLIEEQLRICKTGGVIGIVAPLHMHHREHRQVLTLDSLVGMVKDYGAPVICYVDARDSEAVVGIIKHGP